MGVGGKRMQLPHRRYSVPETVMRKYRMNKEGCDDGGRGKVDRAAQTDTPQQAPAQIEIIKEVVRLGASPWPVRPHRSHSVPPDMWSPTGAPRGSRNSRPLSAVDRMYLPASPEGSEGTDTPRPHGSSLPWTPWGSSSDYPATLPTHTTSTHDSTVPSSTPDTMPATPSRPDPLDPLFRTPAIPAESARIQPVPVLPSRHNDLYSLTTPSSDTGHFSSPELTLDTPLVTMFEEPEVSEVQESRPGSQESKVTAVEAEPAQDTKSVQMPSHHLITFTDTVSSENRGITHTITSSCQTGSPELDQTYSQSVQCSLPPLNKREVTFNIPQTKYDRQTQLETKFFGNLVEEADINSNYKRPVFVDNREYMKQQMKEITEEYRKSFVNEAQKEVKEGEVAVAATTYKDPGQHTDVPRFSAIPRSGSMLVNTSSMDYSSDSDLSLTDSLEDPSDSHESGSWPETRHDSRLVRGELIPPSPRTKHSRSHDTYAYFLFLSGEEDMIRESKLPEHLRDRLRQKEEEIKKLFKIKYDKYMRHTYRRRKKNHRFLSAQSETYSSNNDSKYSSSTPKSSTPRKKVSRGSQCDHSYTSEPKPRRTKHSSQPDGARERALEHSSPEQSTEEQSKALGLVKDQTVTKGSTEDKPTKPGGTEKGPALEEHPKETPVIVVEQVVKDETQPGQKGPKKTEVPESEPESGPAAPSLPTQEQRISESNDVKGKKDVEQRKKTDQDATGSGGDPPSDDRARDANDDLFQCQLDLDLDQPLQVTVNYEFDKSSLISDSDVAKILLNQSPPQQQSPPSAELVEGGLPGQLVELESGASSMQLQNEINTLIDRNLVGSDNLVKEDDTLELGETVVTIRLPVDNAGIDLGSSSGGDSPQVALASDSDLSPDKSETEFLDRSSLGNLLTLTDSSAREPEDIESGRSLSPSAISASVQTTGLDLKCANCESRSKEQVKAEDSDSGVSVRSTGVNTDDVNTDESPEQGDSAPQEPPPRTVALFEVEIEKVENDKNLLNNLNANGRVPPATPYHCLKNKSPGKRTKETSEGAQILEVEANCSKNDKKIQTKPTVGLRISRQMPVIPEERNSSLDSPSDEQVKPINVSPYWKNYYDIPDININQIDDEVKPYKLEEGSKKTYSNKETSTHSDEELRKDKAQDRFEESGPSTSRMGKDSGRETDRPARGAKDRAEEPGKGRRTAGSKGSTSVVIGRFRHITDETKKADGTLSQQQLDKGHKGKAALKEGQEEQLTLSKGWINFYLLRDSQDPGSDTAFPESLNEFVNVDEAVQQYAIEIQATPEPWQSRQSEARSTQTNGKTSVQLPIIDAKERKKGKVRIDDGGMNGAVCLPDISGSSASTSPEEMSRKSPPSQPRPVVEPLPDLQHVDKRNHRTKRTKKEPAIVSPDFSPRDQDILGIVPRNVLTQASRGIEIERSEHSVSSITSSTVIMSESPPPEQLKLPERRRRKSHSTTTKHTTQQTTCINNSNAGSCWTVTVAGSSGCKNQPPPDVEMKLTFGGRERASLKRPDHRHMLEHSPEDTHRLERIEAPPQSRESTKQLTSSHHKSHKQEREEDYDGGGACGYQEGGGDKRSRHHSKREKEREEGLASWRETQSTIFMKRTDLLSKSRKSSGDERSSISDATVLSAQSDFLITGMSITPEIKPRVPTQSERDLVRSYKQHKFAR